MSTARSLGAARNTDQNVTDRGCLVVRCDDAPGVVSAISTFLTDSGANITTL